MSPAVHSPHCEPEYLVCLPSAAVTAAHLSAIRSVDENLNTNVLTQVLQLKSRAFFGTYSRCVQFGFQLKLVLIIY